MQENFSKESEYYLFADVILPVPIPRLYTYKIQGFLIEKVFIGTRVIIEFGSRKVLTGVVVKIHSNAPESYNTKEILEVLDELPIITETQISFWFWMADYYMCCIGEVFNAAIPSGLKISSSSKIQLNPEFKGDHLTFNELEDSLLKVFQHKEILTYEEASRHSNIKQIYPVLKSLVEKGRIILFEEIKEKYKPNYIQKLRLNDNYLTSPALEKLFFQLEKKPKQLQLVLKYLQQVPLNFLIKKNYNGCDKKLLQDKDSNSALNTLIKNKIFYQFSEVEPRYLKDYQEPESINLNAAQKLASEEIGQAFQTKDVALLHGITGSGKTEVFMFMMKQAIDSGAQVLYLLPEIALTTQIVKRLQKVFGKNMAIYHSKFSDNERVDVWHGVLSGEVTLVVGVRSSIFLPFKNLGLVVIDEEHDSSYKQYDPAPRYNAKDSAILLAKLNFAKVLLGSATPTLESYYLANSGQYGLIKMNTRFGEASLPKIILVDMKIEKRNKTLRNNFSKILYDEIIENKNKNRQTILFQNRRGYAPFLSCNDCEYVFKCFNCAVSLTYHLYKKELNCHYCGYKEKPPANCPECSSAKLQTQGFGTEKIEEDLNLFFPELKTERMDHDTTRKKNSYQTIIEDFESNKTNILVGTQMVTKGFDFGNVSLVGILDVDRFLHFPEFRSYEKTFQLITQVSGRAGRREELGKVIIQTNNPTHYVFKKILESDLEGFYENELTERKKFSYPPFSRLIKLIIKDPVEETARKLAGSTIIRLQKNLPNIKILGPEAALITKLKNNFLFVILIKLERNKVNLHKVKAIIIEEIAKEIHPKEFSKSYINIDVDPV